VLRRLLRVLRVLETGFVGGGERSTVGKDIGDTARGVFGAAWGSKQNSYCWRHARTGSTVARHCV
jgi:hypothetical protein